MATTQTNEAVKGSKIIYKYRVLGTATAAQHVAYTTENTRTKSKDADATATKDGTIRTPGVSEVEIECTSMLKKGDTFISALEDAMDEGKLLEIWEINLEEPGTGSDKYKSRYFQGYLTELEVSSDAEDYAEISLSFGVNGSGVKGDATVTASEIAQADYVFKDTTASA